MSTSLFRKACKIVDDHILQTGEQITPEERNRRVMAAEYNLRNGKPADNLDCRSRMTVLSFSVPERSDEGTE